MTESYTFNKIALLPDGFQKRTRNSPFIQNTTVFDAPMHIMLCKLADNEELKNNLLANVKCGNLTAFINSYFQKGILQETLVKRTNVLMMLFKTNMVDGMITMDCSSSDIKKIIEKFGKLLFPTGKKQHQYICKCNPLRISSETISCIDIDDDCWARLENNCNVDFSRNESCSSCNGDIKITFTLNDCLFFVTNRTLFWKEIPKYAIFQGKHYKLTSVIEKVFHYYIAHIQRPNQKWYTFDHTDKTVKRFTFANQMNIHLLGFSANTFYDEFTFQHVLYNTHTQIYEGQAITTCNACAPNTILHFLACQFIDSPELFNTISCTENIIKFLAAYTKNDIDVLYLVRHEMLHPHFNLEQSTINCWTNVKAILDKIIQNILPSLKMWCNCCPQNVQEFPVLGLNYKELTQHGLSEIEKSISHPRRVCVQCQSTITNMKFGNIIFFDVQPIVIETEGVNFLEKEISVHEITQVITLNETQYALKGVIEYESPGHYSVNCQRSNNKWYNFDDRRQIVFELSSKFIPHILMYSKNTQN